MAKKQQARPSGFVLFDVVYEDGTQTSNRKVPATELGGLDGDAPARTFVEVQDRKIGQMSGSPRAPIKTIVRAGKAKAAQAKAAQAKAGLRAGFKAQSKAS
jgi:hypothetical protein